MILDNHYSHAVEPEDVRRINRQRIVFWYPPTNSTQHTMPLDVKLFGPLKRVSYKIRRESYDECLDYRAQVGSLTQQMVNEAFTEDTIRKAFIEPGYVDECAGDNSRASVSPDKLLEKAMPLCALRTRVLEGAVNFSSEGDDSTEETIIHPQDPLRHQKLEKRLDKFRVKKIASLYRKAFLNGSLSIPSAQLNAGSVADEMYAADVEMLLEFFKNDKVMEEEEKQQRKIEKAKRKEAIVQEKERKQQEKAEQLALARADKKSETELIKENRGLRSNLRRAEKKLLASQKTNTCLKKRNETLKRKLNRLEEKYEGLKRRCTKSVVPNKIHELKN